MNVIIRDIAETGYASDALILPLCEGEHAGLYREIDAALHGLIQGVRSSGEFKGKQNQTSLLHTSDRIKPARVLLVGFGKKEEVTSEKLRQAGGRAATCLSDTGVKNVSLSSRYILSLKRSPEPFIEGFLLALYKFRKYKKENNGNGPERLTLLGKTNKSLVDSLAWIESVSSAVHFARDLVNTPSNDMTPSALAKIAKTLAKNGVSVRVLGRAEAKQEGMGAFLSVAQGSDEPPKFIVLTYRGGVGSPIVFVGKSITFDSGGISIKPGEGMEKMKYDMAGGAVVLALIKVASETALPVNLVGILPAAENLPGGSASKPGDIVRTITGKTVEIINTDAEGRLVLADGIGYAKKLNPSAIIDIATLTGACSVALGNEAAAMMGNSNGLMSRLKTIGDETYERVWQMPLYEEYLDYIKSDPADLKNSGGKTGSLVTAAYFLKEFAGDTPWVHLDIAGIAWTDKDRPYIPKGATGMGVRLLSTLLKEMKDENF